MILPIFSGDFNTSPFNIVYAYNLQEHAVYNSLTVSAACNIQHDNITGEK